MWACHFAVKTGLGYGQIESAMMEAHLSAHKTIDRAKLVHSIVTLGAKSTYVTESVHGSTELFTG